MSAPFLLPAAAPAKTTDQDLDLLDMKARGSRLLAESFVGGGGAQVGRLTATGADQVMMGSLAAGAFVVDRSTEARALDHPDIDQGVQGPIHRALIKGKAPPPNLLGDRCGGEVLVGCLEDLQNHRSLNGAFVAMALQLA